jgi:hypothetical protein
MVELSYGTGKQSVQGANEDDGRTSASHSIYDAIKERNSRLLRWWCCNISRHTTKTQTRHTRYKQTTVRVVVVRWTKILIKRAASRHKPRVKLRR